MRVLALDTSTECCSAALLLEGELRLRETLTERDHAALILPMIDALLAESGCALRGLDGIAFGCGPGAFTGLRIAAGVTQGLAFASGLPVVPVSSLAAVGERVDAAPGERILVCNDARMGEVYWAVFTRDSAAQLRRLVSERVAPPSAVLDLARLRHAGGNGLARWPALREALAARGVRIHDGLYPRADAIARLGAEELAAGRGMPPEAAVPSYVRDEVATPASRVTAL